MCYDSFRFWEVSVLGGFGFGKCSLLRCRRPGAAASTNQQKRSDFHGLHRLHILSVYKMKKNSESFYRFQKKRGLGF